MSHQQIPPEQDTAPIWIYIQSANGEIVPYYQVEPYYDLWQSVQEPSYFYGEAYSEVGYSQDNTPPQETDFTSATNYLQTHHQPLVTPFTDPQSSLSVQIPDSHGSSAELLPTSPSGTSVSSSSSAGRVSPDVCNQAQPYLDEETQRWTCGGCNKTFSDKFGTERHIASVGRKVTCRYCGSRISTLESSRRRHFRRETCRKRGIRRGFVTRKEEDAFLE